MDAEFPSSKPLNSRRTACRDDDLRSCSPPGALQRLSAEELDAVIAHEAAHLRGRHHLFVGWATILAQAFPFVPMLRAAPPEVARLVEWIADDQAGGRHGKRNVARALAVMATNGREFTRVPDAALKAAGSGVPERVRRLLRHGVAARSATWWITSALTIPLLALLAAAAVVIPSVTADPTPLCTADLNITDFAG